MNKKMTLGLIASVLLIATLAKGQSPARYQCDPSTSRVLVKGTSTLHDWEMKATSYTVFMMAERTSVSSLNITEGQGVFKADKLESGTSGMDKKAYEALKTKAHPDIIFKVLSVTTIPLSGTKTTIKGELTLAGVKKVVSLPVSVTAIDDSKVLLTSSLSLKMSDYNMVPPVALMGTIKTGDAVTLDFKLTFVKK